MSTGKPLGLLTLQTTFPLNPPDSPKEYIYTSEVSIPLLEGGLLYRGAFVELTDNRASDLFLFANNSVFNFIQIDEIGPFTFQASVPPMGPSANVSTDLAQIVIRTVPDDPQQFVGSVTHLGNTSSTKFVYRDIHDPISAGVITLVVVGAAAFLCALSQIIGFYSNKDCKKVKTNFSLKWRMIRPEFDCAVECLD